MLKDLRKIANAFSRISPKTLLMLLVFGALFPFLNDEIAQGGRELAVCAGFVVAEHAQETVCVSILRRGAPTNWQPETSEVKLQ